MTTVNLGSFAPVGSQNATTLLVSQTAVNGKVAVFTMEMSSPNGFIISPPGQLTFNRVIPNIFRPLGTTEVATVRFGIGPAPGGAATDLSALITPTGDLIYFNPAGSAPINSVYTMPRHLLTSAQQ